MNLTSAALLAGAFVLYALANLLFARAALAEDGARYAATRAFSSVLLLETTIAFVFASFTMEREVAFGTWILWAPFVPILTVVTLRTVDCESRPAVKRRQIRAFAVTSTLVCASSVGCVPGAPEWSRALPGRVAASSNFSFTASSRQTDAPCRYVGLLLGVATKVARCVDLWDVFRGSGPEIPGKPAAALFFAGALANVWAWRVDAPIYYKLDLALDVAASTFAAVAYFFGRSRNRRAKVYAAAVDATKQLLEISDGDSVEVPAAEP